MEAAGDAVLLPLEQIERNGSCVVDFHELVPFARSSGASWIPAWSIAAYGLMPVWASWATGMELSGSRVTAALSVTRNYRAVLALFSDPGRSDPDALSD